MYGASTTTKGHGGAYPPVVTSTVKTITTTYIDSCETGITTKTETITQTVCNKCNGDSVTSTYICHNCGPSVVTITITKPSMPTHVASYPTPPAMPEKPSHGGDKPVPSADVPKKNDYPVDSTITIKSTTVHIVYVTKTPVPVVPEAKHTPVPYPSAPGAGYPVKPVVPTGGYPMPSGVKPSMASGTGTGVPTKPTYAPPQFTGAASSVKVGAVGFLAVVAGLLVV